MKKPNPVRKASQSARPGATLSSANVMVPQPGRLIRPQSRLICRTGQQTRRPGGGLGNQRWVVPLHYNVMRGGGGATIMGSAARGFLARRGFFALTAFLALRAGAGLAALAFVRLEGFLAFAFVLFFLLFLLFRPPLSSPASASSSASMRAITLVHFLAIG